MTNSAIKTRGVVLSLVPFNDQTQFVHIYTEALGKISCKLTIGRTKKRMQQRTLFAPMSVIDMVLSCTNASDLYQIQESAIVFSSYYISATNPGKAAQCMYMAELLDKTINEVEPNAKLWQFITHSVELLNLIEKGSANFHLLFTTRLCYHIGFHVDNSAFKTGMMFDINEGVYTDAPIFHPYYLTPDSASWLHTLLDTKFSTIDQLHLTREQRNTLLDMMLTFLYIHLPECRNLKSVDVLKELFV